MKEPGPRRGRVSEAGGGLERFLGTVGEAMTATVVSVDAEADCQDVALELERERVSGAPVTREGRVVGVVTLRDLAARSGMPIAMASGPFLRFEQRLRGVKVEDVMTRPPVLVRADWALTRAVDAMERSGVNRLPVVSAEGKPVGILARDDVIRALARHARGQWTEEGRPRMRPDQGRSGPR